MQYSRNSIVPTYTNNAPWVSIPPPPSTLVPVYSQNQPINYRMQNNKKSPMTIRGYLLTFFIGLLVGVLLAVAVTVPVIIALNANSGDITTITTEITSTTTTITTSSTTTTSSTSTTTTTMAPLQWNATGTTVAGVLSMTSATATYLYLPIGIWLDSSDTLFVADASNNRIQRFAPGNTSGTTVCGNRNGVVGSNASLFNYPNDVAVDLNGNIYVVDTNNHRVQLWRANATVGITIAGTGTAGNSTSELNSPRGIAFDLNTNTYYVSDTNNNRVLQFTLNSTVGIVVAGGNGAGRNLTQLNDPRGLHFDSSTNSLVIANRGANNIVRWVIGASSWTLVAGSASGAVGNSSTTFNNPWDVTLDSMGNVYVADRYNQRIQFFLANQTNGTTIAGTVGVLGTTATRLNEPLGVAVDSRLNLYVADAQNERIQKFSRY